MSEQTAEITASMLEVGQTIGARIELLAVQKGLPKNQELAKLFGVTYETLRKWRTGTHGPTRAKQNKIATVLAVAPETFMHGVGTQNSVKLPEQEQRLIRAFRSVLNADRDEILRRLEARVTELDEIAGQMASERQKK